MTLPQFFDSNICFLHKSITFAMFIPGSLWYQAIGFGFYKDNSIPTHSIYVLIYIQIEAECGNKS